MLPVLRGDNLRIVVLAIDPSSDGSQGALLGDRIRMRESYADEGVFIRSLATRFAARLSSSENTPVAEAIDQAYQIALSRPATDEEIETMTAFIERQKKLRGEDPNAKSLALRDFCHLVLCLNEFIYIE